MSAARVWTNSDEDRLRHQIDLAGLPDPTRGGISRDLCFSEHGLRVKIEARPWPERVTLTVTPDEIENGEAIRWLRRLIERR